MSGFCDVQEIIIAGKSLLLKECSIRMTKRNGPNQVVYYISLVASKRNGKPANEYFAFDEGSRVDLEETDVKFLDVHALVDEYKVTHPMEEKIVNITVYDLLEDFIVKNPNASFFVDECPFIRTSGIGTLHTNFSASF